jgi:hypothetical protein
VISCPGYHCRERLSQAEPVHDAIPIIISGSSKAPLPALAGCSIEAGTASNRSTTVVNVTQGDCLVPSESADSMRKRYWVSLFQTANCQRVFSYEIAEPRSAGASFARQYSAESEAYR